MNLRTNITSSVDSPAFLLDLSCVKRQAARIASISKRANCSPLYSTKALEMPVVIELVGAYVHGFSTCSPYECCLVHHTLGHDSTLHVTTPHFDVDHYRALLDESDYISFNSLSQLRFNSSRLHCEPSIGLRINPDLSLVSDDRYDPCRQHSKLGVPLDELNANWADLVDEDVRVTGLHFHNNCEGRDFGYLLKTVSHVSNRCGHILDEVQWINLGGGYLFKPEDSLDDFFAAVALLKSQHNLRVFVEPGAAFVREAGYLVSTVVDRFSRDGKEIVVLDTTVNHMPEVFEFQYQPDVLGASDAGKYSYLLAGCSCLAGDLFGEYSFDEPLTVGSRVVFQNVGDYTTPKWHYFNGINLPSIYSLNENDELTLIKQFTYEDFASRYGVESNVVV